MYMLVHTLLRIILIQWCKILHAAPDPGWTAVTSSPNFLLLVLGRSTNLSSMSFDRTALVLPMVAERLEWRTLILCALYTEIAETRSICNWLTEVCTTFITTHFFVSEQTYKGSNNDFSNHISKSPLVTDTFSSRQSLISEYIPIF